MKRLRHSAVVEASAEEVWDAVGAFGHWATWMPTILGEEIEDGWPESRVGCVRRLRTETGAVARERLLALDPLRRTLSYSLEESPNYEVRDYVATLSVQAITEGPGERCMVEWTSEFSAAGAAAEEAIAAGLSERVYRGGLTALAAHFAPRGS